jgi:lipoate-protein ligase A
MITVGDASSEQLRICALLDQRVTEPHLMTWQYSRPALVLGRSQRASSEQRERAMGERVALVTRSSGGGAVMAGPWMLSLTLLLPASHELARVSLPAGYRSVGEACRRALGRFRIRTDLAQGAAAAGHEHASPAERPDWACFATTSHGELLAAGDRKVVGIAQGRRRDAVAICVGVLVDRPDWTALVRIWLGREDGEVVQQLEGRTASCLELASHDRVLSFHSLATALQAEWPAYRLAA